MTTLSRLKSEFNTRRKGISLGLAARGVRRKNRKLAIVYGNCQAEPLRRILESSWDFTSEYRTIRIPPVHSIQPDELALLERLLPDVELIVGQPVREGYRGLALGTDRIVSLTHYSARTITWPSLYWDALLPYMVYVHPEPGHGIQTPMIRYHDLRIMWCASKCMSLEETLRFFDAFVPSEAGLDQVAQEARDSLRVREADCDVKMTDWLSRDEIEGRAFWTVNHPAHFVLERVAREVLMALGSYSPPTDTEDRLTDLVAPIDASVMRNRPTTPREDWKLSGKVLPLPKLLASHLGWYENNPGVVKRGLDEHSQRLATLGLV